MKILILLLFVNCYSVLRDDCIIESVSLLNVVKYPKYIVRLKSQNIDAYIYSDKQYVVGEKCFK